MEKKYTRLAMDSTDVEYRDKSALAKKLGLLTISEFWNDVLHYREDFRKPLGFRLINKQEIYLTGTPVLLQKFDDMDAKLQSFVSRFVSSLNESERKEARKLFFYNILKSDAFLSKTSISDLSLKALLNGTYHESEEGRETLIRYLECLDSYSEKAPITPDADYLAEVYQALRGEEELTSFYREGNSASTSIFFSYDYERAPDGHIEEYLDPFFSFLLDERNKLPAYVKAMAILFYFPYISPFETLNRETAFLLAKDLLAERYGKEAFFLPLESLLMPNRELEQAVKDLRGSADFTYFLAAISKRLDALLPEWDELIKKAKIEVYAPEYNQLSEEEQALVSKEALERPLPPKNEQLTLESFLGEEKPSAPVVEEAKAEEPLAPKEEPIPAPETPSEAPHPEEEPVSEPIKEAEPEPVPETVSEAPIQAEAPQEEPAEAPVSEEPTPIETPAIERPKAPKKAPSEPLPPSHLISEEEMRKERESRLVAAQETDFLSEKEAKEYMKYLLESNPNLSKKQASFLSTHCTPGRYYSIQQFKAHAHCVYETARTSMDKLAREGYYEKLQVKNRFVYTPKKRK